MCLTMHQNMNTFSDLQATELTLDLGLQIAPVGKPVICVTLNFEVLYQGMLEHPLQIQRQLPLLNPARIKIELLEKDYLATQETAAVIEQLRIDDFDLIPNWTQLAQYNNDHNYSQPTNYLGFVGSWELLVDQPFYQWWHTITGQGLLLKLDQ